MLSQANNLCDNLNKTYNFNLLKKYPKIEDIFIEVRDLYEKYPNKFPKVNKTFMSLLYNLENPENQPNVEYLTGPGHISKLESKKYDKVIYLFSENDHSNIPGCLSSFQNIDNFWVNKKHMFIQKYLLSLFKNSPVFIDFYVEFHVMLDRRINITTTITETLWDMYVDMKGCFGPLINRDCPYNVRMNGIDSRRILSSKHKNSTFSLMQDTLMMQNVTSKYGKNFMEFNVFKDKFKDQINQMSKIKNTFDLIKMIEKEIEENTLIMKELKRSTIPSKNIIDFFVYEELPKSLAIYVGSESGTTITRWFNSLNMYQEWPDSENVNRILIILNAVKMDVYTAARMFKVFNVKEFEHYPKEPHNIIYYAGDGHTRPMGRFLEKLGFKTTEQTYGNIRSCVSMKGIKQPLFS